MDEVSNYIYKIVLKYSNQSLAIKFYVLLSLLFISVIFILIKNRAQHEHEENPENARKSTRSIYEIIQFFLTVIIIPVALLFLMDFDEKKLMVQFEVEHLYESANEAIDNDNLESAENTVIRIIDIQPSEPRYHHLLSKIYYREGKYEEALNEADYAINLNSDIAEYHMRKGFVLYAMEDKAAALDEMLLASKLEKSSHRYDWVAYIYYELGSYDLAQEYYQQALDLAPDNAEIHLRYGDALLMGHKYSTALKEYELSSNINKTQEIVERCALAEKAILVEQNPQDVDCIVEFVRALYYSRNTVFYNEGLKYAYSSMGIENTAEANNLLGCIHYALEQYSIAEEDFTRAIELNPNVPEYKSNLEDAINMINQLENM